MNKPQNRRVRYTIQTLQSALIDLMQEKNIHQISVRELCETADINRSTFYAHYDDIYDLLHQIEQHVYEDIDAIFNKKTPTRQDMLQLLYYVQSHKDIFHVFFQQGSDMSMNRFASILHKYYNKKSKKNRTLSDHLEDTYLYELIYTGILGVLQKWLQHDCQDSPQQITDVIWNTIIRLFP